MLRRIARSLQASIVRRRRIIESILVLLLLGLLPLVTLSAISSIVAYYSCSSSYFSANSSIVAYYSFYYFEASGVDYYSGYSYSGLKYLLSASFINALNSSIKALFKAEIIAYKEAIYSIKKLGIVTRYIATGLIKGSRIDES